MTTAVFVDTESLVGGLGAGKFTHVNVDAVVSAACGACGVQYESIDHYAVYGPWWIDHEGLSSVAKTANVSPAKLVSTKYVTGKSVLDSHLIIDAAIHDVSADADTYMIVSSDADMVPLVDRLRSHGRRVVGVGRTNHTKDRTAAAYDRFVWFSRERLLELGPSDGGLAGDAAVLRSWVIEILGSYQELPASNVAAQLRSRIALKAEVQPDEHFESVLGVRQFRKVIGKLFPDDEVVFNDLGNTIEWRSQGVGTLEAPTYRGAPTSSSVRGLSEEAVLAAHLDMDEVPVVWDDERWTVITLPVIHT